MISVTSNYAVLKAYSSCLPGPPRRIIPSKSDLPNLINMFSYVQTIMEEIISDSHVHQRHYAGKQGFHKTGLRSSKISSSVKKEMSLIDLDSVLSLTVPFGKMGAQRLHSSKAKAYSENTK